MSQEPVAVTGIHLKRIGEHAIVAVEIDGKWVDVIKERLDGNFSHIVEPSGIRRCADACKHTFGGWREFSDGNGGEQVCSKCGIGAQTYSLQTGF